MSLLLYQRKRMSTHQCEAPCLKTGRRRRRQTNHFISSDRRSLRPYVFCSVYVAVTRLGFAGPFASTAAASSSGPLFAAREVLTSDRPSITPSLPRLGCVDLIFERYKPDSAWFHARIFESPTRRINGVSTYIFKPGRQQVADMFYYDLK